MSATLRTIKDKLHQYIEEMSEYQCRIVLGFIKRLFNLPD